MTDKQCSAIIVEDRGPDHPCYRLPVVEWDGKPYCRIHDPEYIEKKQAKRNAKWATEYKARQERWALEEARARAVAGLTLEELNQLTPEILREVIHKGVKVL